MISYMYIARGKGIELLGGQTFDVNRKPLSLCHCKFKKRNLILYMYIATGQGQTNTWGQNFDVNRKALSF